MKWSDNTTFFFVQEYLKHECLFNSKCNDYRNKLAREAAVIKICEVINIPDFGPKEALSKIKSIRSTYSQELKKINDSTKSGAGTDDVYIPTLTWFKLYHDVIKDKNLSPSESQSNLNSAGVAMEDTVQTSADGASTSQGGPGSSKISQDITQETEAAKKPVYTRKRSIKCLDSLVNKVKAVGEMIQTPVTNNENEFDIFGRSVAAQLNAMPLMLALQAQSHIQNYLTTLRMHSVANSSNLQTYSPSPPSSTTYISSPSPTINSSALGPSLEDNSTVNLQAYSPPESSPAPYIISTPIVINSSIPGPSLEANNDESLPVVMNSSVLGPSLEINNDESTEVHSNSLQDNTLEMAIKSIIN